jgi:hypothetical protein
LGHDVLLHLLYLGQQSHGHAHDGNDEQMFGAKRQVLRGDPHDITSEPAARRN